MPWQPLSRLNVNSFNGVPTLAVRPWYLAGGYPGCGQATTSKRQVASSKAGHGMLGTLMAHSIHIQLGTTHPGPKKKEALCHAGAAFGHLGHLSWMFMSYNLCAQDEGNACCIWQFFFARPLIKMTRSQRQMTSRETMRWSFKAAHQITAGIQAKNSAGIR